MPLLGLEVELFLQSLNEQRRRRSLRGLSTVVDDIQRVVEAQNSPLLRRGVYLDLEIIPKLTESAIPYFIAVGAH